MRKKNTASKIRFNEDYNKSNLWEVFSRQIGSFIGIFIIFAVGLAALSLVSWNFADPSLNNYVSHEIPTNILGFWGASYADISMQFFGLTSVALLLPPFFWGTLLVAQRNIPHIGRRFAVLFLMICTLCITFAILPTPKSWPMPIGIGGVIGDKLVGLFSLLPFQLSSFFLVVMALFVLFPFSMFLAAYSGAVIFRAHHKSQYKTTDDAEPIGFYSDEETEPDYIEEEVSFKERFNNFCGFVLHHYLRLVGYLSHKFGQKGHEDAAQTTARTEPKLDMEGTDHNNKNTGAVEEQSTKTALTRQEATLSPHAFDESIQAHKNDSDDNFDKPSISFLTPPKKIQQAAEKTQQVLQRNAQNLSNVLEDFGVKGEIIQVYPGPVVTLYELEPAPGVKSSRIISLSDDIARSMSATSARISVMNGRNALGIELPNKSRDTVYLREVFESKDYLETKMKLPLALGQTIGGETTIADLAKMPHLLVAGTTGSGKSVAINTMILSLLYRMSPEECRLIMVDPKMLELSVYDGIPHLLTPVVTDPKKALSALKWAVSEMEERYRKMAKMHVRNIDGFNERVREAQKAGEETLSRTVQTGFDKETGEPVFETEEITLETLPFIVIIIDEMADLMMVAGKEIEGAIQRLAQMARAAGIHVIMATQRPSVDVITGTIKANFPTRISFQVTSKIDSRTILGEQGAEQLLGQGDMLYMEGGGRIKRVHGPFVGDLEVEKVVNHLKQQGSPEYLSTVMDYHDEEGDSNESQSSGSKSDDPYDKAVDIVLRDRKASTSYIQRRLSIGYNRAATLIERMEEDGIISAANHVGKREILVPEREAS